MIEPASAESTGEGRPSGEEHTLPAQRFGAAIEVLLCSGFPTQILLIGVLSALGMPVHLAGGGLSPVVVIAVSLIDAVVVVGLVFFFIHAHHESPRAIFLGRRPVVREALVGLMLVPTLYLVVFAVLALVLTFAPQLHNVPRNPFEDLMQTPGDTLAFGVVVLVAGGVREEIQRAFILRRFEQFLGGGVVGLVVFSVLFGLGHVEQGFDAAVATGALGVVWGAVYLTRRSIVAPMVSHAVFNLAQLLKYVTLVLR